MDILQELRRAIEEGHPSETEALVREALKQNMEPVRLVEDAMMPAMKNVGELYQTQDANIIRILASARSVSRGFELIEQEGNEIVHRELGTVILGTVEGDLHDVGKNLVALMFKSAGFRVIDLGVDISEKRFLQAVRRTPDVSIVCISSLLSTSIPEMQAIVRVLRKNDPKRSYRIMVGGGAVTRELAEQMGADAYTENCVEAARVARTLIR